MSTDDDNKEAGDNSSRAASSRKRKAEVDPTEHDAAAEATDKTNGGVTEAAEEESSSKIVTKKTRLEEGDGKEGALMDVDDVTGRPATKEGKQSKGGGDGAEEAMKEIVVPGPQQKNTESSGHTEATSQGQKPTEQTKPPPKPSGEPGKNQYKSIRWTIVKNDGKTDSLIKLVALKSLFAKQLPKMPRAYIARLVFDRRHISLVILSDDPKVKDTDKEVIGSICYRPFPEMRFAEIAFCAVNSDHQVKVRALRLDADIHIQ